MTAAGILQRASLRLRWFERVTAGHLAIVLAVAGLLHRSGIWLAYAPELTSLVSRNADWLAWQFLQVPAYREHFWASLWYLQQTPPLPHLVFGALIKLTSWPVGVAMALFFLQGLISIATAVLAFRLVLAVLGNRWIAILPALALLFSSDLLLLEYNSFGQTFYENLAMMLLAASCLCLMPAADRPPGELRDRPGRLVLAGVLVALLALTRASFSYYFLVPLLVLAVRRDLRSVLLFLVPVVVLHGGWSFKNHLLYGGFSLATSSWAGLNATIGYSTDPVFLAYLRDHAHADGFPDWFARMTRERGYVHWHPAVFRDYIPSEVRQREDEIQHRLGGTNRSENSLGQKLLADQYLKVVKGFTFAHPDLAWENFTRGFTLFWQPIGSYAARFMGPFYLGQGKRAYLITGTWKDKRGVRARLPTWPLEPLDGVCFYLLHLVALPLAAVQACRVLRGGPDRPPERRDGLLLLALAYAYGALLFNAVDIGENMRFRLSVEPVVLALATAAACLLATAAWRAAPRRISPAA